MNASRGKPKIRYLIFDAFGFGGTVRTVGNMANYLAAQGYDVEIASIMRWRQEPWFPIDPRIHLTVLTDWQSWTPLRWMNWRVLTAAAARAATSSSLIHRDDEAYVAFSRLSDVKLRRYVDSISSGVLVTTRPSLNLISAGEVACGAIRIGQEHLSYGIHPPDLQQSLREKYSGLNALVTLTEGDAAEYRRVLGNCRARILSIPNAVPPTAQAPAALDAKVIIALGRLVPQKGFDLLIDAYSRVASARPDWTLKIFGSGPDRPKLEKMIRERNLGSRVLLMGASTSIERELGQASICALSSRCEGFPMTVVEAMAAGLPVVSFNCPTGPAEIIRHGEDGYIVPPEDKAAFADALLDLAADTAKRKRFGAFARENVRRYSVDVIGRCWTDLISSLS